MKYREEMNIEKLNNNASVRPKNDLHLFALNKDPKTMLCSLILYHVLYCISTLPFVVITSKMFIAANKSKSKKLGKSNSRKEALEGKTFGPARPQAAIENQSKYLTNSCRQAL